jgi:hypothetical protein
VDTTGRLRSGSGGPTAPKLHELILEKDLTVHVGGSFDMRVGSGTNVSVGRVVFAGSSNSTLNLSRTVYASSTEEFNSVIIEKTGGAKVILASGNLFQNNNTSNSPDSLVLISGVVETGRNHWAILRTSSAAIVGASPASYINGIIGRGITNSGSVTSMDFPVGDTANYRPINLRIVGPANATGHYVWATLVGEDANTGSSTLNGGIDKVSSVRYFKFGYLQNAGTANSMGFYGFSPSYGNDDGVTAGNSDLRVAHSLDAGATWTNDGPTTDTTDLTSPPTFIMGDSLLATISLNTGDSILVALARKSGTVTNSLDNPGSSVERVSGIIPGGFELSQNYPNPFNPSTTVYFSIQSPGRVVLKVYDVVGRVVSVLADENMPAGSYRVNWNGTGFPSGIYFYSLTSGGHRETRKMVLMK